MISIKREFEAYLDEMDSITILLPLDVHQGESASFTLLHHERETELPIVSKSMLPHAIKYICKTSEPISIGLKYSIIDEHKRRTDLQIGAVIRTKPFDAYFYYEKDDLGARYRKEQTTFTIWAPTATAVKIKLQRSTMEEASLFSLIREEKGIWRVTIKGDLEGYRYTYLVCVNLIWREAVDPYAIASSINSEAGIVIDQEKVAVPNIPLSPLPGATESIIYELHVRDFSSHSDSGIVHKGKYAAFMEEPKAGLLGKTGFPYLKELGITHVELLPINDYGGVDEEDAEKSYNWGYNPLLFNVPEGSYSLQPEDPYARIQELKALITKLHQHQLRVILDVVYNHVFIRETSSFEKIVPGYYFRHDDHGMPSNGTGVGNDIASEQKMVRKFIIDSVKYWLVEYDVDGFRFDLMGILDVETMNSIYQTVQRIKPGAIILGEGWELNTPLPSEQKAMLWNAKKMPGIAFFNDMVRDSVKGSTFNLFDRGFALGNTHKIPFLKQTLTGSSPFDSKGLFLGPAQSINYVESHDNHTLWDKILICNSHEEEKIRMSRHRLATAIILLAQGIPFLHAGQEFFRTKNGEENSYKSPDSINSLNWERKHTYSDNVNYIKGLIQLRKTHQAFRFATAKEIQSHVCFPYETGALLQYHLKDVQEYGKWKDILVIFHNGLQQESVPLSKKGEWEMLVNATSSGVKTISKVSEKLLVEPLSTTVLVQY
ncbi:Pullulanase [Bacillus sp. THAF10]|uniref:type I pullulanase n=1 Tax=Bacillus sp. THAF10 TaxID=2587848 RepID=UPI0012679F76|nr:type I pullulanase [Bacillus sp. THAF10]QFT90248.1 Pullulanase [Bacillus sp. THAF10]